MNRLLTYGVGEIVSKLASFLFLPLAAIFMTKSEFGSLSFIYPVIISGQGILAFGLSVGFLKYLTDKNTDSSYLKFNVFLAYLSLNVIAFLLLLIFVNYSKLGVYSLGGYSLNDVYVYVFLSASLLSFILITLQIYQSKSKAISFVLVNSGLKVVFITVVLIFLFLFDDVKASVVIKIMIITNLVFAIICMIEVLKGIRFYFDANLFKKLIHIGFPIAISSFVALISSLSGRVFINNEEGIEHVAVFSLMLVLSQSILLFYSTFSRIYIPSLFRKLNECDESAKRMVGLSFNFLNDISLCCISLIYLFFLYLVNNFIDEYNFDPLVFGIMIASYVSYPLYISFADMLSFKMKSKVLMYINILLMFYSLFSSYYLILFFGILGGALSFFSMMLFQSLLIYYYSSKLLFIKNLYISTFKNLFFFSLLVCISSLSDQIWLDLFVIVALGFSCRFYLKRKNFMTVIRLFK